MIEKYIGILPYGINLVDILILIILILIITHIIGSLNRRKIKNELNSIPGYDINQKLISDISNINKNIDSLVKKNKELKFELSNLRSGLDDESENIISIKTLKYNPYKDMGVGGNQSFSTSMVNKKGNGIILTNLYSREQSRVLLKEIKDGKSIQELTPEEKEVL